MKKFQSRNFEKIFLIYRYWIFFFLLIELNNALCMRILWNWNIKAIHQSFFAKARDVAGTNYAEYCTVVGKSIKR